MSSKTPSGGPQRLARRAFLAGAASLPLLTTNTSAEPAEASAELPALIDRWIEQKTLVDALNARERERELKEIENRQMPDPPAALCRRKADARLFRVTDYRLHQPSVPIGEPYTRDEVGLFARRPAMRNRDAGTADMVRERWPLAQARANAIVAAQRQWDEECAALRQRLGVPEIEEALNEAYEAMWDAEDAVNAFHPRSIVDLRLKASFLIDHMYCDQSGGHGSDVFAWNVLRELAGRESLPPM